jgi:hypothetical protein
LIIPALNEAECLVLGARMQSEALRAAMPPHQVFGNNLFTWMLRKRFGLALTDLGPFRAIRRDLLLALEMQEHTCGWPLEMIIKTARLGRPMVELPVTYRRRFAGQSKVGGALRGSLLAADRFFSSYLTLLIVRNDVQYSPTHPFAPGR